MIQRSPQLSDLYIPIAKELRAVQALVERELSHDDPVVADLTRHVQRYQGKMLRPALVLLFGKALGEANRNHRVFGAVVEMVHLATLVHDDVLDEAEIRRGHQTVNLREGNKTAVLLGDFLISHAYHLCASLDDPGAARIIAQTTNTVCEGELVQMALRGHANLDEPHYLRIIEQKTASLTATCCMLGARYSDGSPECVDAARRFGLHSGIAFQIVDDLLDLIGDECITGKTVGRDAALGNATLPVIHCLKHGSEPTRTRLARALSNGMTLDSSELRDMLNECDSVVYARDRAREHVMTALAALDVFPPSDAKDSIAAMAEFILARQC